jgi:hypothetical protein
MYAQLIGTKAVKIEGDAVDLISDNVRILLTGVGGNVTINGDRVLTTADSMELDLGPIGNTPNANGASYSDGTLNLQPASASFGGVVTTGAQVFNGPKAFSNPIAAPSLYIPATDGLNTGTIVQDGERFLSSQGLNNVFLGYQSGSFDENNQDNVAIGYQSFANGVGGWDNVAIGSQAMELAVSTRSNVCIGKNSGRNLTDTFGSDNNTFIGSSSGSQVTGRNNIAIGRSAGRDQTTETDWIEIGGVGGSWEVPIPSFGMRLGNVNTTSCFIAGIAGVTVPDPDNFVVIDTNTFQLGTMAISGFVVPVVTTTSATPTLASGTISTQNPAGPMSIRWEKLGGVVFVTFGPLFITSSDALNTAIIFSGVIPTGFIPAEMKTEAAMMLTNNTVLICCSVVFNQALNRMTIFIPSPDTFTGSYGINTSVTVSYSSATYT